MSRPDGGSAFPIYTEDMNVDGGPGMTLRDYFAAKAMAAIVAKRPCLNGVSRDVIEKEAVRNALGAYCYADAMLSERSKP